MPPARGKPAPIVSEEERLKAERRALNARLRELKARVTEPPEGTILTWTRSFDRPQWRDTEGGETGTYTYCAIRAGDLWHLTGMDDRRYTWDELIDHYLDKADERSVRVASPAKRPFVFRFTR